jgi:hypothetical protein
MHQKQPPAKVAFSSVAPADAATEARSMATVKPISLVRALCIAFPLPY